MRHRSEVGSETLLKWAGIVLVVLAAVFGLGTAISRGWIGPEAQLAGATAGGLVLVATGVRLHPTRLAWGAALLMGGGLVLDLCAAAANAGLGLVPNPAALILLAAVTLALAVIAGWLDLEPVAVVASLAGLALPFWVLAEGDPSYYLAGTLVTAISVGFGAFGVIRRRTLARLSASAAGALALLILLLESEPEWPSAEAVGGLGAALVVGIAAWIGPALAARLAPEGRSWLRGLDHRVVGYLPMWAWILIMVVSGLDGVESAALVGGFTAAAFVAVAVVTQRRLPRTLLITHLLAAGLLAAVAMAVYTQGPALLATVAVQAAVVAVLAHRFQRTGSGSPDLWVQAAVLGLIAVVWTAGAVLRAWAEPVGLGWQLVTGLVVLLVAGAALGAGRQGLVNWARVLAVGAWVLALAWLAGALVHGPQGQAAVSAVWAVAAAGALIVGVRLDDRLVRAVGLTSLAVVLLKLLTVDLAAVDTFWRVGLFLLIGLGLLRLAYVLPRLSRRPTASAP